MPSVDWEKTRMRYRNRWCVGGIDLSAVSDLTCWVVAFPHPDDSELVDVIMRTWCPMDKLHDPRNKYRDQYQAWSDTGWLDVTEGNAIDYDFIRAEIVKDSEVYDLDSISVDRLFQGYEFSMKLNQEIGGTESDPAVVACGMGYLNMAGPCNELERRLLKKKINHGGNPILRFQADSVAVSMDPAGNKKPNKDKSQGKIDGIIGLLLCMDRLLRVKPRRKIMMPVAV